MAGPLVTTTQLHTSCYMQTNKEGLYCSGGKNWISIGSEGDVYPCNSLVYNKDHLLGNMLDGPVKLSTDFMRCPWQGCQQICDRHWSSKAVFKDGVVVDQENVINPSVFEGKKNPAAMIWSASWVCNYNCQYCGLPKDTRKTTADQWVEAFKQFLDLNEFDGGLFNTNGGEPLFYDGIEKVFAFMADRGFAISLTTNLSSDIWNKVVHAAPPEKWGIINCSLHVTEPKFNWEIFAGRILALKAMGYPVSVNYVGHPSQVMLAPEYAEYFTKRGIGFCLIPMIGQYGKFNFPTIESYPPAMRDVLKAHCPDSLKDTNRFDDGKRVESK